MADEAVVENSVGDVKEDVLEDSPVHTTLKDSPENLDVNSGNPSEKDYKVWTEHETRTLISLYKSNALKYPDYSRKLLWEEISRGLKEFGYYKDPERVRNRLKTLKTTYRRVVDYNSSHSVKKEYLYMDDLAELYEVSPALSDDNSSSSGLITSEDIDNNSSYTIADDGDLSRKLRFVRTKSPRSESDFSVPLKIKKVASLSKNPSLKRNVAKKSFTPMFQCGLCLDKFSSSNEMHTHPCSGKVKVEKAATSSARKKPASVQNGKTTFQWNGMSTLQFLIFLKDCKMKPKNSNVHRNLLETLSNLMKKHGIIVSPEDLEKKWKCLAGNYDKTIAYNKKHKDKKKCAFFNRLTELYKLGSSLDMFKVEEPVKMTVEVSPFSYSSSEPRRSNGKSVSQRNNVNHNAERNGIPSGNNSSDLVKWLNIFWGEWKELERQREAAEAQRHMELMEILSYVADGFATK